MANIEEVLNAFRDWVEADTKLQEAQGEYTGYSPGYALEPWYEAADKAKERSGKALADYIAAVIAERGVTP